MSSNTVIHGVSRCHIRIDKRRFTEIFCKILSNYFVVGSGTTQYIYY